MIKFPHIIEISLFPFNPLNVGSMIQIKTHICQFICLFFVVRRFNKHSIFSNFLASCNRTWTWFLAICKLKWSWFSLCWSCDGPVQGGAGSSPIVTLNWIKG